MRIAALSGSGKLRVREDSSNFLLGLLGSGTATRQLVTALNVAEKRRGFEPPFLVDIRLKREGSAPGFRGNTFEKLVGRKRYRWMPTLGNAPSDAGGG